MVDDGGGLFLRRSVGELDLGFFGRFSRVIREGFQHGPGPRLVTGIQHGLHRLEKSRVPEVALSIVAIETIEKGGNVDQLVAGIHEIEVEDVCLVGHGPNVGPAPEF